MTSPRTTTERLTPRLGLVGSVFLHASVVAATFFGVAHTLDIADQTPPDIPVDLVTISDKTNIAPERKAEPLPAPAEPSMVEPQAPPTPEAPKLEVAPAAVTKPVPQKIPPKEQPKKSAADSFNEMLADLKVPNAKTGARNIEAAGAGTGMTADLRAILQSEIQRCWSPPVGAPNVQDLVVVFELSLNPDGSVAQPPQLAANSASAAARNPYTQAAAEAARRAIYQCAPYKLPANRYNQWRSFSYRFDPRDMLGQ